MDWNEIKQWVLSLFRKKPKPMWISVSLYHGDQLIDVFKICPHKGSPVISGSRAHDYKFKIEVI